MVVLSKFTLKNNRVCILTKKYNLQPIVVVGEHVVYKDKEQPDVVIKSGFNKTH